jgi:hypothetical protein
MRRLVVSLLVVGLVVAAGAAIADAAGAWTRLGKRTVDDRVDHDRIVVTGDRGRFTAIKIAVRKRGVEFRKVKVTFGNGQSQNVELKRVLPAGAETRVIDLNGGQRVIRRVDFWYDAQSLGGKAVVVLLGRR